MSFAASSSFSELERVLHLELAPAASGPADMFWNMLWSCVRHVLHAGRRHDLDAGRAPACVSISTSRSSSAALAQHLAEALARVADLAAGLHRRRARWKPMPPPRRRCPAAARRARAPRPRPRARSRDARHRVLALHLHGHVDEVAHDRVDVAADVADLGELRRLDLDERRVRELREPARDLGLADAGRADHQDVLRRDLAAQRLGDLRAPPAVAQRDRDRALGVGLADDVLVELVDDLARRHRHRHHELFDRDLAVRVDADVGGDRERFRDDRARVELGVVEQRARRGLRVRAAGADREQPCSGSITSPLPEMISDWRVVRDDQQRLEPAQHAVRAPVLGELDRGAREVAVLLELRLEALEQRERIGRAAREAREHLAVMQPAHLARVALHHLIAERDLAVAADRDAAVATHANDRRAVKRRSRHRLLVIGAEAQGRADARRQSERFFARG